MKRNYRILASGLFLLAVCVWLFPQQLLNPLLAENSQFPGSTISIPDMIGRLSVGLAILCCLWACLALYWSAADRRSDSKTSFTLGLLVVVGSYLAMAWTLGGWMIDDAAITFAYSKNLMLGHGLVLHPNLEPVEGYSNPLWMLLVALPLAVGIKVSVTAKVLCVLFAVGAIVIAARLVEQSSASDPGYLDMAMFALVAAGAPFVIWSVSGLETPLQTFLFMTVLLGAQRGDRGIWLTAASLSALILTRPETPLIVASVIFFWAVHHWQHNGLSGIQKLWPLLIFPAVTLAALVAFRMWYFGDPLPNTYYQKGADTSFWRVWFGIKYVVRWLLDGYAFILLPFILLWSPRKWSLVAYIAAAIMLGQLGFLAFSGGDWMNGFRFVAPALPVLAFLLIYANNTSVSRWATYIRPLTLLAIPLLTLGSVKQLVAFEVNPSTPISRVAELGLGIVDLAARLGIENPKIAHHDAGGVSYVAELELVDLAGLTNRYIAKNRYYPKRIWDYILVEQQPDFVFGSVEPGFAAIATEFYISRKFLEDYVRLEFPDQPHMSANLGADPLSHVRREWVKPGPGIELLYKGGKLVRVIITPL